MTRRRTTGDSTPPPTERDHHPVAGALSAREREVLRHVALGRSNAEVAAKLAISPHTVRTHLHNIFQKLGIRHRRELMGVALSSGIV